MTSTLPRVVGWLRQRWVFLSATVSTVLFVATMAVLVVRVSEERRLRLDAIAEQARMNRMINMDLCVGLNEANGSVRFILDSGLRLRPPTAPPIVDPQRQAYIDVYRQLPERNCETGEKTYYDPPFPPTPTGGS